MSVGLALGSMAVLAAGSAARRQLRLERRELRVFSVATYLSRTRFRGHFGEDYDLVQNRVEGIKRGDKLSIRRAASDMARHETVLRMIAHGKHGDLHHLDGSRWTGACAVIPVPRSSTSQVNLMSLAESVASELGGQAYPMLKRVEAVPSSRLLRREGKSGVSACRHRSTIDLNGEHWREVSNYRTIILVDEVVVTGATLLAAANVLEDNGFGAKRIIGLTYARSQAEPGNEPDPARGHFDSEVRTQSNLVTEIASLHREDGSRNVAPKLVATSPASGKRLIEHPDITANWKRSLKERPSHRVAVLVPCAATKPFPDAPSHEHGYCKALAGQDVDVYVVSEPLGVVPYAWSRTYPNDAYDFPPEHLKGAARDLLVSRIRVWMDRVGSKYDKVVLALPGHHMRLVKDAGGLPAHVEAGVSACRAASSSSCSSSDFRATSKRYRRWLAAKVRAAVG